MNTLRKSYSVGDVSSDVNPVHRRTVRGGGAILTTLDENDRAPSRTQTNVQAPPASVQLDDSDTEDFDDLFDDIGEGLEGKP